MNENSFGARFCEQRKIDPKDFDAAVLRETMYFHSRLLAPLIQSIWPRHFVADYDFIHGVSQVRRFREFFTEAEDYAHHPENQGFLRVSLNLRISSRRMRRLVREVLHPNMAASDHAEDDHSAVPFGGTAKAGEPQRGRQSVERSA